MTDNIRIVERLYAALAKRDHATMASCYGPAARFSDPVFPALQGAEIGQMWRMLCERGADLQVMAGPAHETDAGRVLIEWEARYTFGATGRPVHNRIEASFYLEGGLIIDHQDRFDLYRWARQALGLPGTLLGWSAAYQRAVRTRARRALEAHVAGTTPP
jgi:limonene-1,2-epoxide hydrolase